MREIHATRPLVVPADAAVETMVTLRPYNESATVSSDKWNEFRVMSWTADRGWSEHCRGLVAVESNSARPGKAELEAGISDKCTADVKSSAIYDLLSKMGITYGPLFMGIDNLTAGPQHATGTFTVPDTAAAMPYNFESLSVRIHPVTVDMCFQFIWPTVTGTSPNLKPLYVLSSIKSIAISSHAPSRPGDTFRAYGHQTPTPMLSKKMAASLYIGHHDQGSEFAIEIDGLTLTRISDEQTWERSSKLAYQLEWISDISSMSANQIQDLSQLLPPSSKVMEEVLILEQASLVFFRRALDQVPSMLVPAPFWAHLPAGDKRKVCQLARFTWVKLAKWAM